MRDVRPKRRTPASMPCEAQQAGEARADQSRWAWVEHCVWTPRMLAALEHGVKGGEWPTAFFVAHGLFNMEAARAVTRQSACGQPPTGEPCAGDPHARFGGRGDREPNRSSLPL